MAGKRRRHTGGQRLVWDVSEWQRAWALAMRRIDGAPLVVTEEATYHHAVDMLDRAFAEGDRFQFELGLVTLIDCCNEAITRGACRQWW